MRQEEQINLLLKAKTGDREAKHQLYYTLEKLAISSANIILRKYTNISEYKDDIYNQARTILYEILNNYDSNRKTKMSTYYGTTIIYKLNEYIHSHLHDGIRVPRYAREHIHFKSVFYNENVVYSNEIIEKQELTNTQRIYIEGLSKKLNTISKNLLLYLTGINNKEIKSLEELAIKLKIPEKKLIKYLNGLHRVVKNDSLNEIKKELSTCKVCRKKFLGRSLHCSRKCRNTLIEVTCICGKIFTKYKSRNTKYCSVLCFKNRKKK